VDAPIGLWSDDGQSGAYSSSVGLIPTNALVLRDLTNFRMVGNPEAIQKRGSGRSELEQRSLAAHFLQRDFWTATSECTS